MANKKNRIEALPLSKAHNNRHSITIIAILVFVMTLVLGTIGAFEMRMSSIKSSINSNFTIEIPHIGHDENNRSVVDKSITYLNSLSGVKEAKEVNQKHLLNITKPWLGNITHLDNIHLPILIEVKTKPGVLINFSKLIDNLREFCPEANIEFHNQWEGLFSKLQNTISSVAYALVACLALAIIFVVMSLTRSFIFSQRNIVISLKLMGATHNYIAKQFDKHMLSICLLGSVIGITLALPILLILKHFIFSIGLTFPNKIQIALMAPIALIPLLLSIFSIIATHLTTGKELRKVDA